MKKIIACLLTIFIFIMTIITAQAEDIIRYTMTHTLDIQKKSFKPTTDDMQEWWNIDLPRDENNNPQYTLEFDTSKVNFTKPGKYEVVLTFYKSVDHKYQKSFNLVIEDKSKKENKIIIGDLEKYYLKQLIFVIVSGIGIYVFISLLLKLSIKKEGYIIVYDNKMITMIKSRNMPTLKQLRKKLNNKDFSSCIVIAKEDIPKYMLEMVKQKNFDYIIELKK